jgi:hypothetical protein
MNTNKEIIYTWKRIESSYDSYWGCPRGWGCGTPKTLQIEKFNELPIELEGILTFDKYNHLTDAINDVLARSHWPICPTALLCFPCLWCFCQCGIPFCESQRQYGLHLSTRYFSREQDFYFEFVSYKHLDKHDNLDFLHLVKRGPSDIQDVAFQTMDRDKLVSNPM